MQESNILSGDRSGKKLAIGSTSQSQSRDRARGINHGACMKGSAQYRKDRRVWFVQWYHSIDRRNYKIYYYKGEKIYDKRIADKLLATMQGDVENGVFRIEKYLKKGWTDTVPYLWEWLEAVKEELAPATFKDYRNSIKNHLEPFFLEHTFQLHEIQYDVLRKLLSSINRTGKGRQNVMYCLHGCLSFAWKSRRIPDLPPFPEKKLYNIQEPVIEWLPSDRQIKIIQAIPLEHQPIFWWLKYHLRRPAEAMALMREDYNSEQDMFIVRRSISDRKQVDKTKTGAVHLIPCHCEFGEIMKKMPSSITKYFFTCKTSRSDGKRYTHKIMSRLWNNACKAVGEDIKMYQGLKHSSCGQYINELGMALSDLQSITDHARIDSVAKYGKMNLARKRELMEGCKVYNMGQSTPKRPPIKKVG